MIETTHIQLDRAAEILGVDADELLLAAFERRLTLYALCDILIDAERGQFIGDNWEWERFEAEYRSFPFVPLAYSVAKNLLSANSFDVLTTVLSEQDSEGRFWASMKGAVKIYVERSSVFVRRKEAQSLQKDRSDLIPHTDAKSHLSAELLLLNQAAEQWWVTAEEEDPSTHPNNSEVADWLVEKGYSKTRAEKAASIIRPTWAHLGRKPEG